MVPKVEVDRKGRPRFVQEKQHKAGNKKPQGKKGKNRKPTTQEQEPAQSIYEEPVIDERVEIGALQTELFHKVRQIKDLEKEVQNLCEEARQIESLKRELQKLRGMFKEVDLDREDWEAGQKEMESERERILDINDNLREKIREKDIQLSEYDKRTSRLHRKLDKSKEENKNLLHDKTVVEAQNKQLAAANEGLEREVAALVEEAEEEKSREQLRQRDHFRRPRAARPHVAFDDEIHRHRW